MAQKEMIISTPSLNSYGSRVLTEGIDTTRYLRNPVLLWMHIRSLDCMDAMPIGRVEGLRVEGDALVGTPVFDMDDPFAAQVAGKWDRGYLKACSAGLEILETSKSKEHLLPGQTRATITRCRLTEVSIVDIGANPDALRLSYGGHELHPSAGEPCQALPLIAHTSNQPHNNNMQAETLHNQTLELMGLAPGATEEQVHQAVQQLKDRADKADTMELAALEATVDAAIRERRITPDKRSHFLELGRKAGAGQLKATLECMAPAIRPTDVIDPASGAPAAKAAYARLSDVPPGELMALRRSQPQEYARLFQAEYGVELDSLRRQ